MKSMRKMKTTSKIFFCCLNSKRTKYIEIILLSINILCFIFYIIFFSTISWYYINFLYQFLFYLDFLFFLINIGINIYFIYIRKKRLINSRKNDIAKTLSISIILICVIALILNYFSSYNICYSIKNFDKNQNIISNNNSKKNHFSSIFFIVIIDIIWFFILLLWVADFIRIKIKSDETFYNYLKKKAFKKNLYLFNEDGLKESQNQLNKNPDSNIKSKVKNKRNNEDLNSINMKLIKDIKDNNKSNDNIRNIDIENNSMELNLSKNDVNNSQASSSLNDSYQKPVNMVIIGTDENGYPIYAHQNSFDKSQVSNDSDSFSYQDNNKKFDQNNYIKYNKEINAEDTLNDNDNIILEKNLILEKDNDEIRVVEKRSENELEKENENENDDKYEPKNFIPLEKEDNLKENEKNDSPLKNEIEGKA